MPRMSDDDTSIFQPDRDVGAPSFTMRDFLRLLFKHKQAILVSFFGVTLPVIGTLLALPATYIAEGKILVRTEQQGTPSFYSGIAAYREPRESDPVNRKLETEMELLATRSLAERVVERLAIKYDQVYHRPLAYALDQLGDAYDWAAGQLYGVRVDSEKRGFRATVTALVNSITVEPLKTKSADTTSNVVLVTLKATDAKLARDALEALLLEYASFNSEHDQKIGREARQLIASKTAEAQAEVRDAQEKLRVFLAGNGGSLARRFASKDDPLQAKFDLRLALSLGAVDLKDDPLAPGSDTGTHATTPVAETMMSPGGDTTIGRLKARLVEMELRYIELRQTFTDETENVRLLKRSIAETRKRVDAEIAASATAEATVATLERKLRSDEMRYLELDRKLGQIDLFLQLGPAETANRVITESPLVPRSSEWRKNVLVGLFGSFAGLILGFGIAGYREYADPRLQSADEVERFLGLKVLTVVDRLEPAEIDAALRLGAPDNQ